MKALTLSIVIPVYNEEDYIVGCLEAVKRQTIKPYEVIVVDNNSSDRTAELVKRYPWVRLIKEKRQGLYFSREAGMKAAKGDILGRIDADTYIDKHWVESVIRAFSNQAVDALSGPVGYYDMPFPGLTQNVEDIVIKTMRRGKYPILMGANMALRREAWKLIEPELCNEPHLFEDIDIAIHLQENGIRPAYRSQMSAGVSSRRFEDKPVAFWRYMRGHTRTHVHHDWDKPVGANFVEGVLALAYIGVKPLHMSYDPSLRRPSLAYLLKRRDARPDPMTTGQPQD